MQQSLKFLLSNPVYIGFQSCLVIFSLSLTTLPSSILQLNDGSMGHERVREQELVMRSRYSPDNLHSPASHSSCWVSLVVSSSPSSGVFRNHLLGSFLLNSDSHPSLSGSYPTISFIPSQLTIAKYLASSGMVTSL